MKRSNLEMIATHRANPTQLAGLSWAGYRHAFREQVRNMRSHEVLSTPRSPWQRA